MTSMHLRSKLGLGVFPAGNDLADVLMSIWMVHLEIAKDGDLGLDDGEFVADAALELPAGEAPVLFHRRPRLQKARDQVFFVHDATVARARAGGDISP